MRDLSEITPLECRYDSRDSFYGKALVKKPRRGRKLL